MHSSEPFAVFIASWIPLVLTAAFPTSGYADPVAETLVVDETEVPLKAVQTFRAIGPLLWLLLPPGDGQAIALYAGAMFSLVGGCCFGTHTALEVKTPRPVTK